MNYYFNEIEISDSGLGYQVVFSETKNDNSDYFLIQRFFDDDIDKDDLEDEQYCYIESHDDDIIGYYDKIKATLTQKKFEIVLNDKLITLNFEINKDKFLELQEVLKIILKGLGDFKSKW